jgi:hypothetical protein
MAGVVHVPVARTACQQWLPGMRMWLTMITATVDSMMIRCRGNGEASIRRFPRGNTKHNFCNNKLTKTTTEL